MFGRPEKTCETLGRHLLKRQLNVSDAGIVLFPTTSTVVSFLKRDVSETVFGIGYKVRKGSYADGSVTNTTGAADFISKRPEVRTAVTMKNIVFWVVTPCSLIRQVPTFRKNLPPPSSGYFETLEPNQTTVSHSKRQY